MLLQIFCQRNLVGIHDRASVKSIINTSPDEVSARQQAGTGRRANRRYVKVIQAYALLGQAIQMGCLNKGIVQVTYISNPLIIGEDENDIGCN
jgi:hypothetical protein